MKRDLLARKLDDYLDGIDWVTTVLELPVGSRNIPQLRRLHCDHPRENCGHDTRHALEWAMMMMMMMMMVVVGRMLGQD